MGRFTAICLGVLALSACGDLPTGGDQLAREAAKGVVNGVVAQRYPGVNVAPLTDCIIENATGAEVLAIAQAAIVGTGPETTQTVLDIARRPETLQCAAQGTMDSYLGNLR